MKRFVAPLTLLALTAPAAAQEVPAPPPMAVREEPAPTIRPDAFAIGIGLGYAMPTDLQAPNLASARFRLPNGVTVEPFAGLAFTASSQDTGTSDSTTTSFGFEAGADLRLPRQIRGPLDLVLIVGGGLGFDRTNPEGADNNTSSFFLDLHWGLGIDYWFRRHWVFSLSATNPAVLVQRQSQQGPTGDTDTSTTSIGAIWEPDVNAMLHLFF